MFYIERQMEDQFVVSLRDMQSLAINYWTKFYKYLEVYYWIILKQFLLVTRSLPIFIFNFIFVINNRRYFKSHYFYTDESKKYIYYSQKHIKLIRVNSRNLSKQYWFENTWSSPFDYTKALKSKSKDQVFPIQYCLLSWKLYSKSLIQKTFLSSTKNKKYLANMWEW